MQRDPASPRFAHPELPPDVGRRLDPDGPLAVEVQLGLLAHVATLLEQRPAAWAPGEDAEPVHDLRVAARRARSILKALAPLWRKREVRDARRRLADLARACGPARDLAVRRARLRAWAGATPAPLGPACARLAEALEPGRARAARRVRAALARFEQQGSPAALVGLLAGRPVDLFGPRPPAAARRGTLRAVDGRAPVRAHLPLLVRPAVDALWSAAAHLDDPLRAADHHAARIAAKRLRYLLELFSEALPDGADRPLRSLRRLQDDLGTLHDLDAWSAELRAGLLADTRGLKRARRKLKAAEGPGDRRLGKAAARLRAALPAGDAADRLLLLEHLAEQRRQAHAAACARWHERCREGLRATLTAAVADA